MQSVRFTTETSSDGVVERDFTVGEVPGVLWSPASGSAFAPLVLMGHGGGLHKKTPALKARARDTVTSWGFNVAAIDAPGHGERPRSAEDERARDGLRQAHAAGDTERFESISVQYTASLTEQAVSEWRATLDALQELPEVGPEAPVGYGGGISMGTAIGIPLTAAEPRITAAVFGGGFFVSESLLEAARRITVPVQFLLPWDDELVSRQTALALFDAFASADKTLHANPGDHRRIRWTGIDQQFLARHFGFTTSSAASLGTGAGPRLRCGIVLRSEDEDACQVLTGGEVVSVRYAPQFPAPRRERVRPGHLVAIAETADAAVVIWRWYDAVILGSDAESVRLWEPAHGEVSARRRRPHQHYAPGTRAYLSSGLPGADWWVAGRATDQPEDADVELGEIERLYTDQGLWTSAFGS